LRSLNVGRNQLGDVGLARIARAFAPARLRDGSWQYNPTFKHLHANANSCLSQEGPLALSESLAPRQNPDGKWAFAAALSTIHLANVLLGEEGGRALADVLRPRRCEPQGVQTAHVGGAAFGGSGGETQNPRVWSVWTFPSNLRVLNLSKTGLGDGGAAHVADALRPRREPDGRWTHNPRLRELHLGGATIGPEGAAALADAIRPRRNGAAGVAGVDDDDALEAVAGPWGRASLRGFVTPRWSFNTALQVLDLRDNVLGPEGVAALAGAVAPVLDQEPGGEESEESEAGAETEATETEAMETDFGSPVAAARRGARSSFSERTEADLSGDRETPKRWLFGGALAVLNLEFNDAGAEGVAALAEALAPRWRAGPRPNSQLGGFPSAGKKTSAGADAHISAFAFGRVVSGNGSWNTNGTSLPNSRPTSRPTSARVGPGPGPQTALYQQGLARDSGGFSSSPGSSLAGSPAVTPRGGSPAPHGSLGTHANDGHARSLPGSAPGSRPQSARSPLAGPGSGREEDLRACAPGLESGSQSGGGGGGSAERTDAKSEPLPFWAANESLRALGVGGNRAGDEGAAALAHAVRPRRNPDGSWTATALVKLDASENAIGAEGLLALARAVDPTFAYAFRDETPSVTLAAVTDPATQAPATTNAIACAHCGKESVARADPPSREASERETHSRCPSTTASSPSSSRQSSRPVSARAQRLGASASLLCECAAPALMLARSFAATSVGGSTPTGLKRAAATGANACASGGTSPRGVVGSGLGSGGATPSPGTEPVEVFHAQARYACDAHSGLRKLDLARNNSDENVRERFNELREKLRRVPSGPVCDVSI